MNDKSYYYTVLKYRPNYLLDEQINVGLLFVFLNENRSVFLFPKNLTRLKTLFPKANIGFIRQYLEAFEWQANQLRNEISFIVENANPDKDKSLPYFLHKSVFIDKPLSDLVAEKFVVPDATSFYFSDWKSGFDNDTDELLKHYHNLYFAVYEHEEATQLIEV
jgi:hypothetical protein